MRSFLPLFFLVATSFATAQLSVRNSNYIFVDAVPIYIENDINLSEIDSKLYLRNSSQLIQGSGTTGNSGLGELSVQQDGTVDEYAYNYWCSPVGNIDSNTAVNNPFRVNLIDDISGPITSTNALFTAAHDGTSTPLTISTRWLYTYITSDDYSGWSFVGSTGAINPGLGFTMKGTNGSGNNQNYEFRGKPNNGTITNSVATGLWTLVGNPYPSAIDALAFIHDPQNIASITGELHFWEQDLSINSHYIEDYIGGYATYTISAGGVDSFTPATFTTYSGGGVATNIPSGSGKKTFKRYIPIGQGFMVEGIANDNVYLKNTHRTYYQETGIDSYFFRANAMATATEDDSDSYGLNIVPEDFKRFRINVDFNDTYTRQLLMNFHSTATNGFDYGLEGKSPTGVASDAYWTSDNVPYVIQAFPYDDTLIIPLVVKLDADQSVRFRMFDVQNFDEGQPIYLRDKALGIFTDLTIQEYEIALSSGTLNDRFEIVFKRETLSIPSIDEASFAIFQNNSNSELTIQNPNTIKINDISVYDMTGKLVLKNSPILPRHAYVMSTANLSSGMYIVKLKVDDANTVVSKKIVVNH